MSLFDSINKVIDVTAHGVRPGAPGEALVDNTAAFNTIINRGGSDGLRVNTAGFSPPFVAPQYRGTLYLPPGRYLFRTDPAITLNWLINFANEVGVNGTFRQEMQDAQQARLARPFGDSVRFPEGTTLWLAPGAVLVPERGCVVDISSLLICGDEGCFDLSLGGLVVFGRAVPVLRPEWWRVSSPARSGVEDVGDSAVIQYAIDAAIHNRSIVYPFVYPQYVVAGGQNVLSRWYRGEKSIRRPSLVVEFRGEYTLQQTVNVRADALHNGIWLQRRTPGNTSDSLPSGATSFTRDGIASSEAATVLRGVWNGGRFRGATLNAGKRLGENPLLRLTFCQGMTVENLTFVCPSGGYQPGIEFRASSVEEFGGAFLAAAQDIAVRQCRFDGTAQPMVQVGARTELFTGRPRLTELPYAIGRNDAGTDLSLLSFEDCEFVLFDRAIGIDVRANQSFAMRYTRCDFKGGAAAMLSLWGGSHYLHGCRFFNNWRVPSSTPLPSNPTDSRGFELPDSSDLFLRAELPMLVPAAVAAPRGALAAYTRLALSSPGGQAVVVTNQDFLPSVLTLGCVSDSVQFLSTVAPGPLVSAQNADWPVVLVGTRHRAPSGSVAPSVRWGLINTARVATRGPDSRRDMKRGGPLAIVGGFYSGGMFVLRAACQSAVVGARMGVTPGVWMEGGANPVGSWPATTVFGLRADQGRPL